jgi:hypothetical protein
MAVYFTNCNFVALTSYRDRERNRGGVDLPTCVSTLFPYAVLLALLASTFISCLRVGGLGGAGESKNLQCSFRLLQQNQRRCIIEIFAAQSSSVVKFLTTVYWLSAPLLIPSSYPLLTPFLPVFPWWMPNFNTRGATDRWKSTPAIYIYI